MTRALDTYPAEYARVVFRAIDTPIRITLPTHQDALRLRWRLHKFRRDAHASPTHPVLAAACDAVRITVRRNTLILRHKDTLSYATIEELNL